MPKTMPKTSPNRVAAAADDAGPDSVDLPTPPAPRGLLARQVHAFAADFWAQMLSPPVPVRRSQGEVRQTAPMD